MKRQREEDKAKAQAERKAQQLAKQVEILPISLDSNQCRSTEVVISFVETKSRKGGCATPRGATDVSTVQTCAGRSAGKQAVAGDYYCSLVYSCHSCAPFIKQFVQENIAKHAGSEHGEASAGAEAAPVDQLSEAEIARRERIWRRQQAVRHNTYVWVTISIVTVVIFQAERRIASQGRKKRVQTERAVNPPKPRYFCGPRLCISPTH